MKNNSKKMLLCVISGLTLMSNFNLGIFGMKSSNYQAKSNYQAERMYLNGYFYDAAERLCSLYEKGIYGTEEERKEMEEIEGEIWEKYYNDYIGTKKENMVYNLLEKHRLAYIVDKKIDEEKYEKAREEDYLEEIEEDNYWNDLGEKLVQGKNFKYNNFDL